MPRPTRHRRPDAPNSVIASAARITTPKAKKAVNGMQPWQREAIEFADEVGELAFVEQWTANALSKVSLHVAEVTINEDGETAVTRSDDPTANAALGALFYGEAGQSQMMASFGHHLHTPGESWLFGVVPDAGSSSDDDTWRVLSVEELTQSAGGWEVNLGDGQVEKYTTDECLPIRIWRPHPIKQAQATSPVRAAIPILRELRGLTMHIASTIDSRLTGAGVMIVPTEATFGSPLDINADPLDGGGQRDLLTEWAMLMAAARRDQASAAAQVPLLLRVPAQYAAAIQHIDISTTLDTSALELRSECIRRLGLALDAPPEVLTGNADSNHWSAWLSDDDSIKMHVEPLVELTTNAITVKYLWPALQGSAPTLDPALRRFIIIGDTSELRQRPNKTTEALALHESIKISDAALFRETGFDESDAPDDEEVKRRLLILAAMGKVNPMLAEAALAAFGLDLPETAPPHVSVVENPGAPTDAAVPAVAPAPAPAALPAGQSNPQSPPEPAAALPLAAAAAVGPHPAAVLASAELICKRAAERATARIGHRRLSRSPAPQAITDALADAWTAVPETAALLGVDPDRLQRACDGYTRRMLSEGGNHDRMRLAGYLHTMVLAPPREFVGG